MTDWLILINYFILIVSVLVKAEWVYLLIAIKINLFISAIDRIKQRQVKKRDFPHFCSDTFNDEVATIDWSLIIERPGTNIDEIFTSFYKTFNKIVNKHAPIITFSKRKIKQFSKPRITKGLRISIQAKNRSYHSRDLEKYKCYRSKICTLIRFSKKNYYYEFFKNNLDDMRKTWQATNALLNRRKRNCKPINKLKGPQIINSIVNDLSRILNIINKYSLSVGNKLANKMPQAENSYIDYLSNSKSPDTSLFFKPVTSHEVKLEILSIPNNSPRLIFLVMKKIRMLLLHIKTALNFLGY